MTNNMEELGLEGLSNTTEGLVPEQENTAENATVDSEETALEEELTVHDVVHSLVGVDSEGNLKAAIVIALVKFQDEEEPEVLKQFTLFNTYLSNVAYPGDFVMTELEFKLKSNSYLDTLREVVQEFYSLTEKEEDYGFLMSIAGLQDKDKYFLSLECPLICIQGYSDISHLPTKMQMLFPIDGFKILPVDYDVEEIRAEIAREFAAEEAASEKAVDVDELVSDIDKQVKAAYGLNEEGYEKAEKKEVKNSLDGHIKVTKR